MIRPKIVLVTADLLLAFFALHAAYVLRLVTLDFSGIHKTSLLRLFFYLVVVIFSSYFFELYERQKFSRKGFLASRIPIALVLSFVVLSSVFYVLPEGQFGRGLLLISLAVFALFQAGARVLILKFSNRAQFATRIIFIGAGQYAREMSEMIKLDDNPHSFIRFVTCTNNEPDVDPDLIVGDIARIDEIVQECRPQKLVIALKERRGNLPLKQLMQTKLRGVEILDAVRFFEQESLSLMVEGVQPSAFIYTQGFKMTTFMRSYKRITDIIFSLIGLTISGPFFPFIALAIKIDSAGPVFFKQLRVGEGEEEFYVYKFRTMAQDAEKATGAVWAQKNDPRVTRLGKFMRKTRIDEIPQLINVLMGDMSLIGPRPERMPFVERLKETIPFYSTRHLVKPGVTGWAQVCYPYGASDEDALEKLRYDLYYIKNYSIFLDFRIIIDTIRVVISGFGGR